MGNGTPLGKVRGLGSSHSGAHHWWLERLTGVFALAPLVFLLVSFLLLPDLGFKSVAGWIAAPVPALAMALLLVATFWHTRLGLRVFIEDYVHTSANKVAALLAVDLLAYAGAAFGLFCLVRLALGGAA